MQFLSRQDDPSRDAQPFTPWLDQEKIRFQIALPRRTDRETAGGVPNAMRPGALSYRRMELRTQPRVRVQPAYAEYCGTREIEDDIARLELRPATHRCPGTAARR
jgi:hypothetical protein